VRVAGKGTSRITNGAGLDQAANLGSPKWDRAEEIDLRPLTQQTADQVRADESAAPSDGDAPAG
jgi:hypothetical protein